MKVLLNQDIERLGRMGEVVEVAGGYARNYLIPRGLAVGVTRSRLREVEERKKLLEKKAARERERVEGVAEKIRSRKIVVKARCSATGRLFGSVTNRQLAQEIESLTGEEIDRHRIVIDGRIRAVGTYSARIKLHHDVELDLQFEVEGEGFVPEEPSGALDEEEGGGGAESEGGPDLGGAEAEQPSAEEEAGGLSGESEEEEGAVRPTDGGE